MNTKKKTLCVVFALIVGLFTAIPAYAADQYIEADLKPFCTVDTPLGGGSKDINLINDGVLDDSNGQYDTFIEGMEPYEIAFGYTFEKAYIVKQVEFTEGNHFHDGGWYANGDIKVQALVGDKWVDVESMKITPDYPNSDFIEDFGEAYETYTFTFTPIECMGIQVFGTAGGSATFASCVELKVLASEPEAEVVAVEEVVEAPVEAVPEAAAPAPVEAQPVVAEPIPAPATSDMSLLYLAIAGMAIAALVVLKRRNTAA